MTDTDRRPANLTAILLLLGLIVGGIWVWKHLSPDTQDALIEHALPIVLAVLGATGLIWVIVRNVRSRVARRRRLERLIARFERETNPAQRLDLAFSVIECNDYRVAGLDRVAPALKDLLLHTLTTHKGDKQHRTRGMAASHLGVLQDRSVVPALLAALEDDHAYVRSCAALGLGRLRAREARETLAKVMEDDWDQTVRSRAREALERIG